MPTYDYACAGCGGFEALRRVADRDAPVACPQCGAAAPRVLAAPQLPLLDTATRRAMDLNDRARHEPQSSRSYARLRHPSGCSCCASRGRGATVTAGNGNKSFPSKRPWMISH